MISYELAKQLREAGFQGARVQHCFKDHYHIYSNKCEYLPAPTLSELIEACGEGFFAISHWYDGWQSEGGPILEGPKDGDGKRNFTAQLQFKFCATPEEAVAKLYIALHGK